jgi:hypothetical protein
MFTVRHLFKLQAVILFYFSWAFAEFDGGKESLLWPTIRTTYFAGLAHIGCPQVGPHAGLLLFYFRHHLRGVS